MADTITATSDCGWGDMELVAKVNKGREIQKAFGAIVIFVLPLSKHHPLRRVLLKTEFLGLR